MNLYNIVFITIPILYSIYNIYYYLIKLYFYDLDTLYNL